MGAGDCAVFATSLLHDAAAWTEDYHRINMFQRYTLSAYFNENPYSNALPHEDQRSHISDAMYELVSSPSPGLGPSPLHTLLGLSSHISTFWSRAPWLS